MVESELLNQELLIQSRLSSQNQRLDEQLRKLDKTDKSVKKLRKDLAQTEFLASDFSSVVQEALPAVVKITYEVELTPAPIFGSVSLEEVKEKVKEKLSKKGLIKIFHQFPKKTRFSWAQERHAFFGFNWW